MGWSEALNTISDKDYKALQDRAHKHNPSWFDSKTVERRKANSEQLRKRKSS